MRLFEIMAAKDYISGKDFIRIINPLTVMVKCKKFNRSRKTQRIGIYN